MKYAIAKNGQYLVSPFHPYPFASTHPVKGAVIFYDSILVAQSVAYILGAHVQPVDEQQAGFVS